MKKIIALIICVISFFSLLSCDWNGPLRNKMLDYYVQDENYSELIGEIRGFKYNEKYDCLFIEVELLTENEDFRYNAITGYYEFELINWSTYKFDLEINDKITFTSAPMQFYEGQDLPIVRIERESVEYLSFTKGKEDYIRYITETFN